MKNWSKTTKIVVAIVAILILLAIFNWKAVSAKLGIDGKVDAPVLDANGNPTGTTIRVPKISAAARGLDCCSIAGGFIGKGCKFPVKKTDIISPCASR